VPTSWDSSKLCFWRLHSNAWMKSDPFVWPCSGWRSTSSSSISKSGVPYVQIHTFAQLTWWPLTQQLVNRKYTCWISRKIEFQLRICIILKSAWHLNWASLKFALNCIYLGVMYHSHKNTGGLQVVHHWYSLLVRVNMLFLVFLCICTKWKVYQRRYIC
jgi:hypothetical protein